MTHLLLQHNSSIGGQKNNDSIFCKNCSWVSPSSSMFVASHFSVCLESTEIILHWSLFHFWHICNWNTLWKIPNKQFLSRVKLPRFIGLIIIFFLALDPIRIVPERVIWILIEQIIMQLPCIFAQSTLNFHTMCKCFQIFAKNKSLNFFESPYLSFVI